MLGSQMHGSGAQEWRDGGARGGSRKPLSLSRRLGPRPGSRNSRRVDVESASDTDGDGDESDAIEGARNRRGAASRLRVHPSSAKGSSGGAEEEKEDFRARKGGSARGKEAPASWAELQSTIKDAERGKAGRRGGEDAYSIDLDIPEGFAEDSEEEMYAQAKLPWYILNPGGCFRRYWDLYHLILLFYVAFFVPYRVAFKEAKDAHTENILLICEIVTDVSFGVDIVLNFFTAYADKGADYRLETRISRIAKRYLRSYFFIDLIATFPFAYITGDGNSRWAWFGKLARFPRLLRILRVLRLLKLMRVYKLQLYVVRLESVYSINRGVSRMMNIIFLIMLVTHFVGCFWYLIGDSSSQHRSDCEWYYLCTSGALSVDDPDELCALQAFAPDFKPGHCAWVTREGYFMRSNEDAYAAAIYWAFSTLTTVGYGDISATNGTEQSFSMCIMLLGVSWYAYIVGSMSSIMASFDGRARIIREKVTAVHEFVRDLRLPYDLGRRVRSFYDFSLRKKNPWARAQNYNAEEILAGLSSQLRTEVILFVEKPLIESIPFLRDKTPRCQADVVMALHPIVVQESEYVVREGSAADEMYFLTKGRAAVLYGTKVMKVMLPGSYFGEDGCIKGGLRHASIKAVTLCELQALSKRNLQLLMDEYPELDRQLRQTMKQRLRKLSKRRKSAKALHQERRTSVTLQELSKLQNRGTRGGDDTQTVSMIKQAILQDAIRAPSPASPLLPSPSLPSPASLVSPAGYAGSVYGYASSQASASAEDMQIVTPRPVRGAPLSLSSPEASTGSEVRAQRHLPGDRGRYFGGPVRGAPAGLPFSGGHGLGLYGAGFSATQQRALTEYLDERFERITHILDLLLAQSQRGSTAADPVADAVSEEGEL